MRSNSVDVCSERRVAPVIPGRLLGIAGHAIAGGLQQRSRRGGIEAWIVARRQVELAPRSTSVVPIIIDKSAGHVRKTVDGRRETGDKTIFPLIRFYGGLDFLQCKNDETP